jgi:predicted RNase H-like HicB family nuclease
MRLVVELDRETDGRWIAEVVDLPGVLVYGATRETALAAAQALALRVVADKLEHGEAPAVPLDLSFVVHAA